MPNQPTTSIIDTHNLPRCIATLNRMLADTRVSATRIHLDGRDLVNGPEQPEGFEITGVMDIGENVALILGGAPSLHGTHYRFYPGCRVTIGWKTVRIDYPQSNVPDRNTVVVLTIIGQKIIGSS